ncbi:crossover junction endodeoxyribonuclease RuvC [Patescibacteria group bacterium]|nr:crossover junction endodeoxyribonuclease RuvC [Patescibacteria group bacterium]
MMPTNMRVLAIDPGYDRLGVAVLDKNLKNGDLLFSTCIITEKADDFSVRMKHIAHKVENLLLTYKPTIVALERLYFNTNQKTALQVAEVRGVMVYLAKTHSCTLVEYTPQEIKVAVTGYGKSDKKQVAFMVKRLITNVKEGALDDEYDAIAIGITALARER